MSRSGFDGARTLLSAGARLAQSRCCLSATAMAPGSPCDEHPGTRLCDQISWRQAMCARVQEFCHVVLHRSKRSDDSCRGYKVEQFIEMIRRFRVGDLPESPTREASRTRATRSKPKRTL